MKLFSLISILFIFQTSFAQDKVVINNKTLPVETVNAFQSKYAIRIQNGDYWYDKMSGAWGMRGGPTLGLILPGLNIGGVLQANASNGRTGVFINGRQIHYQDLKSLQQLLGNVLPGSYRVDAYGNAGYQGGPAMVNLWQLSRKQQSSFYRNSYTGIGAGSSGGTSYVMGKDWSVMVGN